MKDAQQAAEAYAKETMLSGKTPEEIAYIAFFAGTEWQRQKAEVLVRALEKISKMTIEANPWTVVPALGSGEAKAALEAYMGKQDEPMEGIHIP